MFYFLVGFEKLDDLMVIKRNGKKVPFDETKIALAIKKGFDSVEEDSDDEEKARKYNSQDIQKVYQAVLKRITKEAKNTDKFPIKQILPFLHKIAKSVMLYKLKLFIKKMFNKPIGKSEYIELQDRVVGKI